MNSKKNKGLGKGLSALFGEQKSQENQGKSGHNIRKALVGEISRNSFQPRTIFDESKLDELAMSIKKNGIIQPIAVRKSKSTKEPYEIVAGERRWLAAQKAGLHEVPILIMDLNDSETLEVAINLGIDSNKTDQGVRGVTSLPKGTGKSINVAVLAKGDKQKEAKDAGADLVGENDLIETISSGKISFDLLIASPDMMPSVGKVAKILGPKGLMPNPKLGTVTADIANAVKNAKAGQVQFKNDKGGIVHAGIGKMSFNENDLLENLKFFYSSINKSKPETVKGSFIKKVTIASTMGVGLEINLASLR